MPKTGVNIFGISLMSVPNEMVMHISITADRQAKFTVMVQN
jgi:hypothetical protein